MEGHIIKSSDKIEKSNLSNNLHITGEFYWTCLHKYIFFMTSKTLEFKKIDSNRQNNILSSYIYQLGEKNKRERRGRKSEGEDEDAN